MSLLNKPFWSDEAIVLLLKFVKRSADTIGRSTSVSEDRTVGTSPTFGSSIVSPESCHLIVDYLTFLTSIFHFMLDPDPEPDALRFRFRRQKVTVLVPVPQLCSARSLLWWEGEGFHGLNARSKIFTAWTYLLCLDPEERGSGGVCHLWWLGACLQEVSGNGEHFPAYSWYFFGIIFLSLPVYVS